VNRLKHLALASAIAEICFTATAFKSEVSSQRRHRCRTRTARNALGLGAIGEVDNEVLVATWLTSGCASTVSSDDLGGFATPDVRTGLCNDATPPPCSPPRD
jgi:hypothetical protein